MDHDQLREQNRRSWNAVVPVHASHHADLIGFLRGGGSTLFADDRALLGDVAGKRVAHLLCNTGHATLSIEQLGAIVTGVDLSDAAIDQARQLATAIDSQASFVCADVYDWIDQTARSDQRFDVIYAAYGVICWLHDLGRWARGVATLLDRGGRCVLIEFHPVSNMFDQNWQLARSYPQNGQLLPLDGVGDYVGAAQGGLTPSGFASGVQHFRNPEPCYLHQWGVGEVVTALAGAGLRIEVLHEYPYTNGERPFDRMREGDDRRMFPPNDVPSIPLMYALVAEKS